MLLWPRDIVHTTHCLFRSAVGPVYPLSTQKASSATEYSQGGSALETSHDASHACDKEVRAFNPHGVKSDTFVQTRAWMYRKDVRANTTVLMLVTGWAAESRERNGGTNPKDSDSAGRSSDPKTMPSNRWCIPTDRLHP